MPLGRSRKTYSAPAEDGVNPEDRGLLRRYAPVSLRLFVDTVLGGGITSGIGNTVLEHHVAIVVKDACGMGCVGPSGELVDDRNDDLF